MEIRLKLAWRPTRRQKVLDIADDFTVRLIGDVDYKAPVDLIETRTYERDGNVIVIAEFEHAKWAVDASTDDIIGTWSKTTPDEQIILDTTSETIDDEPATNQ